jgi:3-hydroxyisobutyrate dehydrogenase-like beta-hydroxyacid dehydrogenase
MLTAGERREGVDATSQPVVGVVGLGTMGGAMAQHLLTAGYQVIGRDVEPASEQRFAAAGGTVAKSAAAVAAAVDVAILSLPSVAAFEDVVYGPQGFVDAGSTRCRIVVETSTLPRELKKSAHTVLAAHGLELLDCPISGTGGQMAVRDVIYYASGDELAIDAVEPLLRACGRGVFRLGAFGNGTRLKLIANLLVTIHNASAAEALALARAGGIDPGDALPALVAGAGTSRMLEVRGPMMVAEEYEPAAMKVRLFMKDVGIISVFAEEVGCTVPVFEAAARLHEEALEAGFGEADPASVHAVARRRRLPS